MELGIAVTLSDNVTVVRPVQSPKAFSPMFMLVLPPANATPVRPVQR